jgi:hypothetical protein
MCLKSLYLILSYYSNPPLLQSSAMPFTPVSESADSIPFEKRQTTPCGPFMDSLLRSSYRRWLFPVSEVIFMKANNER